MIKLGKRMSRADRELYSQLVGGIDHADAPNQSGDTKLGKGLNNPPFVAQFDVVTTALIFTINGGAYTKIAVGAIDADLLTDLPVVLFGQSDSAAGFPRFKANYPNQNANYTVGKIGIFGKDSGFSFDGEAVVENELTEGDQVQELTSPEPGTGTTTLVVIRTHCNQVGYGSLLNDLVAADFRINQIRYKVPSGKEAQFDEPISIYKQSIFGKSGQDTISPVSFVSPMQQQANIVDVPVNQVINREMALITNLDFSNSNVTYTWSMYIARVAKNI